MLNFYRLAYGIWATVGIGVLLAAFLWIASQVKIIWLPLACDGEIHRAASTDKTCDVGFAGTVSPAHRRRAHLLKDIGAENGR